MTARGELARALGHIRYQLGLFCAVAREGGRRRLNSQRPEELYVSQYFDL